MLRAPRDGELLQPDQVLPQLRALGAGRVACEIARGQLPEARGRERRLGALDDRPYLLPDQLRVVASVVLVVGVDARELGHAHFARGREVCGDGRRDLLQQLAEHEKARCLRFFRALPFLHETRVDPLCEPFQQGIVGEEKPSTRGSRPQEIVDGKRCLAAARGTGEQHGRHDVQELFLLRGEEKERLEGVGIRG